MHSGIIFLPINCKNIDDINPLELPVAVAYVAAPDDEVAIDFAWEISPKSAEMLSQTANVAPSPGKNFIRLSGEDDIFRSVEIGKHQLIGRTDVVSGYRESGARIHMELPSSNASVLHPTPSWPLNIGSPIIERSVVILSSGK
ncbi:MAG: hypothetical protein LBI61_03595 [Puniceicoccales bacterium]|jgi:hypothetical protein|nr:hypothetical protein [Puniceicoccales bacterium]